jgi:very-short-patch-repair endonuclease
MATPRDFARSLRKAPSRAERALWRMLRDRGEGVKFRRQHPIPPYTADFACVAAKLIVEVDGLSHSIDDQIAHDARRAEFLASQGWRILRVRDADVLSDPAAVLSRIVAALQASR